MEEYQAAKKINLEVALEREATFKNTNNNSRYSLFCHGAGVLHKFLISSKSRWFSSLWNKQIKHMGWVHCKFCLQLYSVRISKRKLLTSRNTDFMVMNWECCHLRAMLVPPKTEGLFKPFTSGRRFPSDQNLTWDRR